MGVIESMGLCLPKNSKVLAIRNQLVCLVATGAAYVLKVRSSNPVGLLLDLSYAHILVEEAITLRSGIWLTNN